MYMKAEYSLNLCVKKINVFYSGNNNCPFLVDILSINNDYFRCAAGIENLAKFILAQENDELYISLHTIFPASSVLGVCDCQNLSHSFFNLEKGIRDRISHPFPMNVKKTFVLPMPFVQQSGNILMQDSYYCMIEDINSCYIAFKTQAMNVPHIISSLENDKIELKLYAFDAQDTLELIYFKNHSRNLADINQRMFNF